MAKTQVEGGRSRREMIQLASGAGLGLLAQQYSFAASEFWISKKPSEWSDKEKDEIRTKSPWAKKVDAQASGGRGGGGMDTGGLGSAESSGGGGGGRGGRGGGGRGGGEGGGGGGAAAVELSIVWESARPIQDAHPLTLPSKLDNHYVIAVTGIPGPTLNRILMGGRGRGRGPDAQGGAPAEPPAAPADQTAPLRAGVTMGVKGKDPVNPDAIMSMNRNSTILFGFPKDALPITAADKEVDFVIKLTGLSAKTKFTLKDMMYNDQLAI